MKRWFGGKGQRYIPGSAPERPTPPKAKPGKPEPTLADLLVRAVEDDNEKLLVVKLKDNAEAVHSRKPTRLGNGATLIMVAVALKRPKCMRVLMDFGADPLMRGCWFTQEDELDAYELAVALSGFEGAVDLTKKSAKGTDLEKEMATEPDVFRFFAQRNRLEPISFHPEMRVKRVACGLACSGA